MPREAISSTAIAPAVGPFSSAVRAGEFVFLSGQVAAQTEQIFKNLRAVLAAAGKTLADVVRVAVYLTDMKNFAPMNAVYAQNLEPPYPARTTVAVAELPMGALVEIDLVAR